MEAFRKYTNINPETPEGEVLVNTHFITQSAPDIRRKLQKAAVGPQTPRNWLVELAFGVFNNRDRVEEAKRIQGQQRKAQFLAAAFIPAPPRGYPPQRPTVRTGSRMPGSGPLSHQKGTRVKCSQEGH